MLTSTTPPSTAPAPGFATYSPILIERRAADALRVLPSAEGPPSTGLKRDPAIDIDSPVSHDQRWISPDRSVETSSTVEHAVLTNAEISPVTPERQVGRAEVAMERNTAGASARHVPREISIGLDGLSYAGSSRRGCVGPFWP